MKIKDREYLYASARVRTLESHLLGRDDAERMLEAESAADAVKVLSELGYPELDGNPSVSLERAISAERERTFSLIRDISPNPEIVNVFSIKYDYHNIKTLIKAAAVNQSAEHLMINAGRISTTSLAECLRQDDLSCLPPIMRAAYEDARDTLARTSDAQIADFILDRAMFSEMIGCAESSGSDFLLGYVRLMIDAVNLRAAVRALRQGKSAEFIREMFFAGGNITPAQLSAEISSGDFPANLFASSYLEAAAELASTLIASNGSLTAFERLCDDALCNYLQSAKYSAFGDAPVVAYLAAKEIELGTIRILLTAKLQNLPADEIRERLRATYV